MEEVIEEIPEPLFVKLIKEIAAAGEQPVRQAGEGGEMRRELRAVSRGDIIPRLLKQRNAALAEEGPRDKGTPANSTAVRIIRITTFLSIIIIAPQKEEQAEELRLSSGSFVYLLDGDALC